jgi:predicted ATPase
MRATSDRFFVLTGGPGSGKTTLIEALGAASFPTSVEAGRAVIRDQSAIGGPALPWNDPAAFAELMLSWEMRSYAIALVADGTVFFDRGMPDVVGYLRLTGLPVPAHIEKAAEVFRYNRKVFILPPWPHIFSQDTERRQSFGEARRTFDAMAETYARFGYDLISVPTGPIVERMEFICKQTGVGMGLPKDPESAKCGLRQPQA